MLNTNNTVNYETNIKQKEKKYSWSTVFSWLYLKTIGRILPKKWNKWAENILYYNKATGSDEIRTDKTTDESAQIDLKPEVTVKESQSEIVSEDEKVQTNKDEATVQDTTMQTECVETTDKNIGADLKPEVAEKGSQSEIISKDGEVQTEENSEFTDESYFGTTVSDEFIDEDYNSMEEVSTEEDEELKKQLEDVSQELELERSQNVLLKEEKRELQSIIEKLEENYKKLAEDADKREEELVVVKEKDMKINSLTWSNKALEQDKKEMEAEVENLKKQLQSVQESKQQLEEGKIDLEGKLKDLSSQLSAAEVEKKSSENEVSKLRKQVQILEGSKEWELAGIDDSLKETFFSVMELLAQQLPLNNQEQQKLQEQVEHLNAELERVRGIAMSSIQAHSETLDENLTLKNQQIESSTAKGEQQNGKLTEDIQGQTKTKASDAASFMGTVSTVKSTTGSSKSTLSKLWNLPNKLSRDKGLNNVLDETIKSLLNKNSGKFESKELLKLLENNLKQSAREIIEAKVKEVVNEHCNIGKNMGKELRDDTLKAKLSPSVRKCVKKLEFNKQEGVNKIVDSILHSFNSKNNNNNDSVELLKEIVVKELVEARMRFFLDKIQELQLTSSIRDKFLSTDQGMCNQTQGGVNEYQLTEKAKKEYTPNSSMSHANAASICPSNSQKTVKVDP